MKLFKFSVFFLSALALSSCSKRALSEPEEPITEDEVSIKFAFGLADLNSPISRPLISEDSIQRVLDMRVYVFVSKTGDTDDSFFYYRPTVGNESVDYLFIPKFFEDKEDLKDWDDINFESGRWEFRPKLPSGYHYRFLAIGLDETDQDNTDRADINWTALNTLTDLASTPNSNITTWNTALIKFSDRNEDDDPKGFVSEIFSGWIDEETSVPAQVYVGQGAQNHFHISLTLKRAVAGVLLYVKNIPARVVSDYTFNNKQGFPVSKTKEAYPLDKIAVVSVGHHVSLDPIKHEITSTKDRKIALKEIAWIDLNPVNTNYSVEEDDNETYYYKSGNTESYTFPATGNFIAPARLYDHNDPSGLTLSNMPDMAENGRLNLGTKDITDNPSSYLRHLSGEEGCDLPSSLYLVFYTKDLTENAYYPLKVKAIKNVRNYGDENEVDHDDYNMYGLHYNFLANHIYCLGRKATNGVDEPLDLKEALNEPNVKIWVMGSYQADVDIPM